MEFDARRRLGHDASSRALAERSVEADSVALIEIDRTLLLASVVSSLRAGARVGVSARAIQRSANDAGVEQQYFAQGEEDGLEVDPRARLSLDRVQRSPEVFVDG